MKAFAALAQSRTNIFSVFCIGTSHVHEEENNTIAVLGKACGSGGLINDGPGTRKGWFDNKFNGLVGWGMNDKLEATIAAIKKLAPLPDVVNMTGHSRGAILCHMIAHRLYTDPTTRHITVNMIVLDPVHQSLVPHAGAEHLDDNPNLKSYQAILMENEDQGVKGAPNFPFKFVEAPESMSKRIHYIRMPGSHGSGSQNITNPVGTATLHLIANFMRARGTQFPSIGKPTALDMCEYFADIHTKNPMLGTGRVVFDDGGHAQAHKKKNQTVRTTDFRQKALEQVLYHQQKFGTPLVQGVPLGLAPRYFFNEEHAYYFKQVCPYFFDVLAAPQNHRMRNEQRFHQDYTTMHSRTELRGTFRLLMAQMPPHWR